MHIQRPVLVVSQGGLAPVAVRLAVGPAMLGSHQLKLLGDHMRDRLAAESAKLDAVQAVAPPPPALTNALVDEL